MKWFVSRQQYWHTGDFVVEIAEGGLDYANPDMLVERYSELGEGKEFTDPREALAAAFKIRDAWNSKIPVIHPRIEIGYTGGMTFPFEENPTDEELEKQVEEIVNQLPTCMNCKERILDDVFTTGCSDELIYCSANCREDHLEEMYGLNDEPEDLEDDYLAEWRTNDG